MASSGGWCALREVVEVMLEEDEVELLDAIWVGVVVVVRFVESGVEKVVWLCGIVLAVV